MKILIVNDDGYNCPGLVKLATILSKYHDVRVVAPHKCNSGMSAAVTFHKPIYIREVPGYPYLCYSVTGTPSDCVKIGVELFSTTRPELIISGINTDFNIGTDVFYSGTANAAIEGSLNNIPSMAISTKVIENEQFNYVVDTFLKDFDYYLSLLSPKYALNININNEYIGNIDKVICKLGKRQFCDIYLIDPSGTDTLSWTLIGNPIPIENDLDTDVVWLNKGYTTITPIQYNSTDIKALNLLKRRILPKGS
ncbi:MAG TPA: 5'/3'-nucleotidase SurE [Clostridia bacterium]|mgnify:CR=1 FL=1|jgi:5'-nucleotidase|nr:5'/3'-nucleotidase SurE [Clostridia bacterium]